MIWSYFTFLFKHSEKMAKIIQKLEKRHIAFNNYRKIVSERFGPVEMMVKGTSKYSSTKVI